MVPVPGRPADAVADAWPPRLAQEARLDELDRLAASGCCDRDRAPPGANDRLVERAALLNALGRPADAREAYLDVLKRAPHHFGALNDFSGALLVATGFRTAARTVYAEAVRRHPDNPTGHVNLANLMLREGEHLAARVHFETTLRLDPGHPQAHQGLAAVLAELGDHEGAARHRRKGYARNFMTMLPYRGTAPTSAAAAQGFGRGRRYSDCAVSRRSHLPRLRRGGGVLRPCGGSAAASAGFQRHRGCRPVPGRAGGGGLAHGAHGRSGD